MVIWVEMVRTRLYALAAVALIVVPLVWSYVDSFGFWWVVFIIAVAALIALWFLFPRPQRPEIRGEDAYHLHP